MKNMKTLIIYLLLFTFPVLSIAQGNKGKSEQCAPMENGKVCYTDDIAMKGASQESLYNAISAWAKAEYGKDVFISNVSCNKGKKTILVSSKIELLLNETEKTALKYKMYITCHKENYKVKIDNLAYQYASDGSKRTKTYPAETVIADNGKGNTVEAIKDPELFCNATHFFAEGLLDEVFVAAKEH